MSDVMQKWAQPQDIDDVFMAFPTSIVGSLLPLMEDIPDEFKQWRGNPYCKLQAQWFFNGLNPDVLIAKEGIDKNTALRHLSACQGSFEPKHQHKEAGVAWLMSLWFDIAEEAHSD